MRRIILIVTAFLLCFAAPSCGAAKEPKGDNPAAQSPSQPAVITLTSQEAYDRITSGDPVVILDVRTAEEYAAAHISGAILLPNETIGDTIPQIIPVLDAEILIYCRSGNRSAQAASKLEELGYTNLADFGGINDWTFGTVSGEWEIKAATLSSFRTSDLSGAIKDESLFSGHELTMINIWGTFCEPCLREMPELGELSREYAPKGVQIVGLVIDAYASDGTISMAQVDKARKLASTTGADYLHLLPSEDLMTARLSEVSSIPETIFVDSEGNIVGQIIVGARSGSDWTKIIDDLLGQG